MKQKNTLRLVLIYLLLAAALTGCAEPPWKFIVTGDTRGSDNGVNKTILSEISAEIVKNKVDFVLLSGDLVNGYVDQTNLQSQLNNWRNTTKPIYNAGIDVYVVRGNHDLGEPPGTAAWDNIFKNKFSLPDNGPKGEKNLTYSVKHKNALIVGLDQYVNLRRVNQTWLDAQLEANTKPHVFVFGHEPAFKARHEGCLDDYPAERDTFLAGIERAGGRTYFCGHDHFYNHARIDGDGDPNNDIHQFIIGTAGAPLHDWPGIYDGNNSNYTIENIHYAKQYGYCLVEIDGLDVTLSWMERAAAGEYKAKEVWTYTAAAKVPQR